MTKRYAILAFLCVAIALFFGLHNSVLGVSPGGTAHGQQAANLAMAQGFVDNGLDFWHPKTKALNYSNGDFSLNTISSNGITAAHFPIHAYIPAVLHTITDWDLSMMVQYYNVLWGFIGLFFLYLLALRMTNHIGKSLFLLVFFGTAPIFAFYQSNFLPEIPSISCSLAGIYFYCRWMEKHAERYFWMTVVWFLFACLPSPDFVLYFAGSVGLMLLQMSVKERLSLKFIGGILGCAILFFLANLWYLSLKNSYGSQFPDLLQDWVYDQSVWNSLFRSWKLHYFTVFQTVIGVLIVFVTIFFVLRNKQWKSIQWNRYSIVLIGALPVFYALINPYQAYYFDVFFLKFLLIPAMLISIVIVDLVKLDVVARFPKISGVGFLLVLFVMISEGNWTQNVHKELNRTSPGTNLAFTFQGGDELLFKYGVKATDELSVVVPNNWGIGYEILEHFNHKGVIREVPNGEELVPRFPKGHYVVCHLDEKPFLYDHFGTNFNELGNNGSIVLFKAID